MNTQSAHSWKLNLTDESVSCITIEFSISEGRENCRFRRWLEHKKTSSNERK